MFLSTRHNYLNTSEFYFLHGNSQVFTFSVGTNCLTKLSTTLPSMVFILKLRVCRVFLLFCFVAAAVLFVEQDPSILKSCNSFSRIISANSRRTFFWNFRSNSSLVSSAGSVHSVQGRFSVSGSAVCLILYSWLSCTPSSTSSSTLKNKTHTSEDVKNKDTGKSLNQRRESHIYFGFPITLILDTNEHVNATYIQSAVSNKCIYV